MFQNAPLTKYDRMWIYVYVFGIKRMRVFCRMILHSAFAVIKISKIGVVFCIAKGNWGVKGLQVLD